MNNKRNISFALLAAFCLSMFASSAFAATSFFVTTSKVDVTAEGTQARFNGEAQTGGRFNFYAPKISVTTFWKNETGARYRLSVIGDIIGDAWFQYWDRYGQGFETHGRFANDTQHLSEWEAPITRCWNQITFLDASGNPIGTTRMNAWFGPSRKGSNMNGCLRLAGGVNDFHFPVVYMGSTEYSVYAQNPDGVFTEIPVAGNFYDRWNHWGFQYNKNFTTRSAPKASADAPQEKFDPKSLKVIKQNDLKSFLKSKKQSQAALVSSNAKIIEVEKAAGSEKAVGSKSTKATDKRKK